MDLLEQNIKEHFAQSLIQITGLELSLTQIIEGIQPAKNAKKADYQFNVNYLHRFRALQRGQEVKLAQTWAQALQEHVNELITEFSVESSFLLLKANQAKIIQTVLDEVTQEQNRYGCLDSRGKTILVEYSSPNIAKAFHVGHLRSTIIGSFLAKLFKTQGYEVVSINYLGDWGKQYGLLALAYKRWGDEEQLKTNPIHHLLDLYVKINAQLKAEQSALSDPENERAQTDLEAQEHFNRMEAGDPDSLQFWQQLRELSIKVYEKMYHRLGVHFDQYSGESQAVNLIPEMLANLEKHELLSKDDKGTFVDLKPYNLGRAVMLKSDHTTMYLTRDLAEIDRRLAQWDFERCYYVVGNPQQHHFKQFFKILELSESPAQGRCQHIGFGQVLGMKTREGTAVLLSDILDEAKNKMLEIMRENEEKIQMVQNPEKTADLLGISAILIQDQSAKRGEDYSFDYDRMTSSKGETGPYLQYAHARICSIIRKVGAQGVEYNPQADISLLVEPEAFQLAKLIGAYPRTLRRCAEVLETVPLVEYLMDLAKGISVAHATLRVKDMDKSLAEARLLLLWAARLTLNLGMCLLGLTPIEAM